MRFCMFIILSFTLPAITLAESTVEAGQLPNAPLSQDTVPGKERKNTLKSRSFTCNPFSILIGRLGANIEYMPAPHHGIMLSPYVWSWVWDWKSHNRTEEEVSGKDKGRGIKYEGGDWGVELGYRYYTGVEGPEGFFIGSYIYVAKDTPFFSIMAIRDKTTSTVWGVALQFGRQFLFDSGFTCGVGGSFEFQLRSPSQKTAPLILKPGCELLVACGYSF